MLVRVLWWIIGGTYVLQRMTLMIVMAGYHHNITRLVFQDWNVVNWIESIRLS